MTHVQPPLSNRGEGFSKKHQFHLHIFESVIRQGRCEEIQQANNLGKENMININTVNLKERMPLNKTMDMFQ